MSSVAADVDGRGFSLVPGLMTTAQVDRFRILAGRLAADAQAGVRDIFRAAPEARALVDELPLCALLEGVVGAKAVIVRATLFDKTRRANWRVPWHQDLFVALAAVSDVRGFTAWTLKNGVAHARAPRDLLERMVAVRLHIDDCDVDQGPLRVLPGTHRGGILDAATIDALSATVVPVTCTAPAGAALVMRPLLLHASSSATAPAHRRVLHLDVADGALPDPLRWHDTTPMRG